MSYDLQFGVKVEGMDGYIAVIDEPEYAEPTYNLRDMFVACMDWEYEQGKWYSCEEVLPRFERGAHELRFHASKYKKYNPPNGWGSISSALECIDSVIRKMHEIVDGGYTWNEIPLQHLYFRW